MQADDIQEKEVEDDEFYKLAIQGLAVGLWDWDVRANTEYWSPRFREILGIENTQFKPTRDSFTSRLHPDDLLLVMQQVQEHFDSRKVFEMEYRIRHERGNYIWVYARGQATWDMEGNPVRMVGSVDDITKRKEVEEKLKLSVEDLSEFTYIVSHDLKEPLRGIENYAKFALEDFDDTLIREAKESFKTVIRLSERMQLFIDSLLECSRVNQVDNYLKHTDLNEVVKHVLENLEYALKEARAEVIVESTLPSINCDPTRITEVFHNLILNGIKYNNSRDKLIRISNGMTDNNFPVISISDNGIGIDPKDHCQVFKVFRRLHARDAYGGGSGAGLTIVKKIVERHKGHIWLDSEVGKGTTFYFTLDPNLFINNL